LNLSKVKFSEAKLEGAAFSGAELSEANLSEANLERADLTAARLTKANLRKANLSKARLYGANLVMADLSEAGLSEADLRRADLSGTHLRRADLSGTTLSRASISEARLDGANLRRAQLDETILLYSNLSETNLTRADLTGANLSMAKLTKADLSGANLVGAQLVGTDISHSNLTGSFVYGVAAWDVKLTVDTRQENLIITPFGEPIIEVDNIKVAQFIYLLLNNEEIRDVIDTIGRKGVLLLGRFTDGRIAVLERLRAELRKRGFVPMVFNFDKPEVKDFTETVRLLAGLSHFVIAEITSPKSTPLELQATVPECMVPFVPILQKGEEPFAMFKDLWIKHREWVRTPIRYSSVDRLIKGLDEQIVRPAEKMFVRLLARKAKNYPSRIFRKLRPTRAVR
jgi:uncharacterized protein YjbI with pentapeptide repeats